MMRPELSSPVLLVCLAAAAAAVPRPLSGQAAADTVILVPRVVTATRTPDPLAAAPVAATVIAGTDLRARGVAFVADALREVPGTMLVQSGSYGAPTSLFLRGGESDDVKVLLDGIPLNVPGGGVNLANLGTADLDRIEIVRGPASVLYGADAMSGVIQLFTRTGTGAPHGAITAQGGTFDTGDLSADLAGGTGPWSFSGIVSRFSSAGIYSFNSGYRDVVGTGQMRWERGEDKVALVGRWGDAIDHFPTDAGGAAVDHNQFSTETTFDLALEATHPITGSVSLDMHPYAARTNSGYRNTPDTPADTSGFDFDASSGVITWRRGVDARADWRAASALLVTAGSGVERETDHEQSIDVSNFGAGVERDSAGLARGRTTTNAYLQLLADPGAGWSMQLGGRIDDNTAFGTFGTWRAGIAWQRGTSLRVWSAAGTAFKAPTFGELFASSAFETGNPALEPERSTDAEVGAEARVDRGRVTTALTAFEQQFRHLIQYVSAAPGEPTYLNLGGARSRGLEATVAVVASHALRVTGHWTWLSTGVTDTGAASSLGFAAGERLLRRPSSSGGAVAEFRAGRTTLSAAANWVGSRDDVEYNRSPAARVTLPSYATVDLGVNLPVVGRGHSFPDAELTLRAENLFDAAYQQTVGFPGRGRTLLAGARLRF